jgi:Co/Zn/Cd efflux system component
MAVILVILGSIWKRVKLVFWFVTDNWRVTLPVLGVIVLLVLIALAYRGCKRQAKIDLQSIEKINTANRQEREAELRKVITENQDVIKMVDERTAIAETQVEVREQVIEEKIKEADKKIVEAKSQGKDVTSAELECILIPANCTQ